MNSIGVRAPTDEHVRRQLCSDFETTYFVEAGAGTGKTSVMVDRIVGLIREGHVTVDHLAAVTFTEAAASELRARVRTGLEQELAVRTPSLAADRCAAALHGLEQADIDTIHAFAAKLLRTYPLEAGLPPNFETLEPIEQKTDFRDYFRTWFDAMDTSTPEGLAMGRAFLLGLRPAKLESLAIDLYEQYDLLTATNSWDNDVATCALTVVRDVAPRLDEVISYLPHCLNSENDKLYPLVCRLRGVVRQVNEVQSEQDALLALVLLDRIPSPNGRKDNWDTVDPIGNVCTHIKNVLASMSRQVADALRDQRAAAMAGVLGALSHMLLDYAADRKRRGVAGFHDLLTWARDLLQSDEEVRNRARRKWQRVVVDEFQDTDPLQAEIAFLLCGRVGEDAPREWRNTPLEPGKLTVVGDPKQSIYRFRRADIAVYDAVKEAIAAQGRVVHLVENFRSIPTVIDFVNAHFSQHIQPEGGVQPVYVPLSAYVAGAGPAVYSMGGPVEGMQEAVWQAEASAVAQQARRIVEEEWTIRDGEGSPRSAAFNDVCVLIPSRTNLRRLEDAFNQWDVPYRLESGALILATQEVRELISCLRAIDDPSDQVALVAALRSPAYGCSDVDLLRWKRSGGRFNYLNSGQGTEEHVRNSLDHIRDYHDRRNDNSPAALIEQFLDDRLLLAASLVDRRPRDIWRRYRYVTEQARRFEMSSSGGFRAFVDWMEFLERDQRPDTVGLASDDEPEVRVLTVHGAKGLEFPVVILTGTGSINSSPMEAVLVDRVEGRIEAKADPLASDGYDALCQHEKKLRTAEDMRLMYVAATRARDHLIVSLHRKAADQRSNATLYAATIDAFEPAVRLSGFMAGSPEQAIADRDGPAECSPDRQRVEEDAWAEHRAERIATLRSLHTTSATGTAHDRDDGERRQDVASYRRGRGGTSIGRAVHAVLQTIDLRNPEQHLASLATAQANAEGIPERTERVTELILAACGSRPVQRALQADRFWREVPIGATIDGRIFEGFIDLLAQDSEGLYIVDYKTDDISPREIDERMQTYQTQGQIYAALTEQVTGIAVKSIEFVFVAAGETRMVQAPATGK